MEPCLFPHLLKKKVPIYFSYLGECCITFTKWRDDTWTSRRAPSAAPSAAPFSESFFKNSLSYQPLQSGHFEPLHHLISRLRKLNSDNRPAVRTTVQCQTFTSSLSKNKEYHACMCRTVQFNRLDLFLKCFEGSCGSSGRGGLSFQ